MRIELNTKERTIRLEENVMLGEFIDLLSSMFPNQDWRLYTLETTVAISHTPSPIIINPYSPAWPWWGQPWIIYKETTGDYDIRSGVYDIIISE